MADNPNPDEDFSYYQRTVVLRDWWLIKCSIEFQGKRFGVAGTQIAETGAVRVFTSSPIIKAYDVFTLEASDGVCIILRGFLNKHRLSLSGFLPQISREFILGFPPCWESKCNHCFLGVVDNNNNTEEEINDIVVGRCSTSRVDDDKPSTKKSLRLQSKSLEVRRNVTSDHCSEGLSKAKSCGVVAKEVVSPADNVDKVTTSEEGELEPATKACPPSLSQDLEKSGKKAAAASNKSGRILRSYGNVVVVVGEHVSRSGSKVKRKLDVVSELLKNPTAIDGSKKITRKNANKESLTTSEQRKVSDNSSSKHGKNGNSKKSEKILQAGDLDYVSVEPLTHWRSKVKDNLSSVGKTIRKIDFDAEVTPEKDAKKQRTNNAVVSPDSLGQKRSRSGRVLVSPLQYWRNQVPVYDADWNLIQVKEGHQTNSTPPSKGKGSVSRKPRR